MFKSGKLKKWVNWYYFVSLIFLKTNIYLGSSWMAFKIPTTMKGTKVFFVLFFYVYKQSLLIHEYCTTAEVLRGMISFIDKYIYSLVKVYHWWSWNHDCVFFFLCTACLHIWKLSNCKKLLFSNSKLICALLCLSIVGWCPGGISHHQPKARRAAVDCIKRYCRVSLTGWLETILWCWISCLKLKRCRVITLTF